MSEKSESQSEADLINRGLMGLSLVESVVMPDGDETQEAIFDNLSAPEFNSALINFATIWLVRESHLHQIPMDEYLKDLRQHMLESTIYPGQS